VLLKYDGYIKKQVEQVRRFQKLEEKLLPEDMDYRSIKALSAEAAEKLDKLRPRSIGQASRISGVSPADVNVLLVLLTQRRGRKPADTPAAPAEGVSTHD